MDKSDSYKQELNVRVINTQTSNYCPHNYKNTFIIL